MAKREFTAVFQKRPKGYIAWVEEIPGVDTQGRTKQEARGNLREALELILESNRALAARHHRRALREPLRVAIPA